MRLFDLLINILKLHGVVVSCENNIRGDTIRVGCQWALPKKKISDVFPDWITTVIKGKAGRCIGVCYYSYQSEDEIKSRKSRLNNIHVFKARALGTPPTAFHLMVWSLSLSSHATGRVHTHINTTFSQFMKCAWTCCSVAKKWTARVKERWEKEKK